MTNNDTIKEVLGTLRRAITILYGHGHNRDAAAGTAAQYRAERALDDVGQAIEALRADNAALLEEAHKACFMCFGLLTYKLSCPYCGDSTYDHDCVEETRPCSASIHKRLSEPHPGAELLEEVKRLRGVKEVADRYLAAIGTPAEGDDGTTFPSPEKLMEMLKERANLRNRVVLLETERDALGSQLLDVQQECIAQRKRADAADAEVKAVLDNMPGAIRVCEGGGPEDIYKSLAVSVGMLTTKAASLECKLAKAEARAEKAEETLRCIGERLVAEGASRDVPILEMLNTTLEREDRLKRERDVFREGLKSAAKCLGNGIPFIADSNAKNVLATARIAILALVNGPVPQRPSTEGKS